MFNTLQQIQTTYKKHLQAIYSVNEIRNFISILASHILSYSRIDCIMNEKKELNEVNIKFFKDSLNKLIQDVPIQQIVGETEFYDLPFKVSKDVLIPRPETEELVQWILNDYNNNVSILDIGTGSGCIPITLKYNLPDANVSAWDISDAALLIAKENAHINNVEVCFQKRDVLKYDSILNAKLDVIVSNPPYIRELEKHWMSNNVLEHEPHLALFVSDDDPLIFYRVIANIAKANLKKGGRLYFEINEALGQDMIKLLTDIGFKNIELRKDLFGKDRMIKAVNLF